MSLNFTAIILLLLAAIPSAKAELGFAFVATGKAAPKLLEGRDVGPFGVRFIAEPKLRFMPRPTIPKVLKEQKKESYVRAALLVGADGKVQEVNILEAEPKHQVEKDALRFLPRVVYMPDKKANFETDVILAFRHVEGRK